VNPGLRPQLVGMTLALTPKPLGRELGFHQMRGRAVFARSATLGMQTGLASWPDGEAKVLVLGEETACEELRAADGGYLRRYRGIATDWQQIADSRGP
jgi:hypothetical protein